MVYEPTAPVLTVPVIFICELMSPMIGSDAVAPSSIYEVSVEKWLRHHFEAETVIDDALVKLPIEIVQTPS